MICASEDAKPLGFVRAHTDDVIAACEGTIERVHSYRRFRRRKSIRKIFQKQCRLWRRYGRWMGIIPPTRKSAEWEYENETPGGFRMPERAFDKIAGDYNYQDAKKIKAAAKAAERPVMWISVEAAQRIRLNRLEREGH